MSRDVMLCKKKITNPKKEKKSRNEWQNFENHFVFCHFLFSRDSLRVHKKTQVRFIRL